MLYSLISVNIWYPKNKLWIHEKNFFMLKDKINNIYINCYKYNYDTINEKMYDKYLRKLKLVLKFKAIFHFDILAHQYFDTFTGQFFLNDEDKLIINETTELLSEKIIVYHHYDTVYFNKMFLNQHEKKRSLSEPKIFRRFRKFWPKADNRKKLTIATFRKELDYEKTSKIEYTIDIKNKRIEGVFEVIRKPEIEIKQFHLPIEQQAIPASCEIEKMMTNYLFNFNYPFIRGKEKINMAISGAYNFDERFKEEKGKELEEKLKNKDIILDKFSGILEETGIAYYMKIKDFRCLDILYYDDELICIYKRTVEVDEETNELIVKNHSLIFELESEKSISSYLRDLVVDSKELLSNYELTDNFYNNINKLIFLLTDTGIIVMPEYPNMKLDNGDECLENPNIETAERIFISSNDLKNYLNETHYLFNFFNRKELV
nr:hypothetical protein [Brachyspira alvinipulli]